MILQIDEIISITTTHSDWNDSRQSILRNIAPTYSLALGCDNYTESSLFSVAFYLSPDTINVE